MIPNLNTIGLVILIGIISTAITGCSNLLLSSSDSPWYCLPRECVVTPKPSGYDNRDLAEAIQILRNEKPTEALPLLDAFIERHQQVAAEMQASLKEYPWISKEQIFSYGPLNDVAQALYMKGEALLLLGRRSEAGVAFSRILNEFYFAQWWCPRGLFNKPADYALEQIERGVQEWLNDRKPKGRWFWQDLAHYKDLYISAPSFKRYRGRIIEKQDFAGGVLALEVPWENGRRHGTMIAYTPKGKIRFRQEYRDGRPYGLGAWFKADGSKMHEFEFEKGEIVRMFSFGPAGTLIEDVDVREGVVRTFEPDSQLAQERHLDEWDLEVYRHELPIVLYPRVADFSANWDEAGE